MSATIVMPKYEEEATMVGLMIGGTPEEIEAGITGLEFPVQIVMPCQTIISFRDAAQVPRHTVPCQCGNPKHFEVLIQ